MTPKQCKGCKMLDVVTYQSGARRYYCGTTPLAKIASCRRINDNQKPKNNEETSN